MELYMERKLAAIGCRPPHARSHSRPRIWVRWLTLLQLAIGFAAFVGTGRALAVPTQRVFALIVTNNKSVALAQPDLQYADDDGARYYQLLRSIAAEPDVVLLTTFDRATAGIYPDLARSARAPTRAQVQLAIHSLGAAVAQARAHGEPT